MPTDCISYRDTGYFTPLINDYLDQVPKLAPLYNRFPTLDNFEAQMQEKSAQFTAAQRDVLVSALQRQYAGMDKGGPTEDNMAKLARENTFTITTGHQLNLFTGPLYFLYKIVSAINLARELQARYPESHFVPVYWMATEDHDFAEINHFHFKGRKLVWNRESSGPVGRLDTGGLDEVYKVFAASAGLGDNAAKVSELFKKAYLEHENLAAATRFLAHELFGAYGLVIVDGDDQELKSQFIPHAARELTTQFSHKAAQTAIAKLQGYDIQVNPREINLFYMEDGLRERIEKQQDRFVVINTAKSFSREEILRELEAHPEKFSPNVILRPLYEEVILPNLCYIGGGGELAYWLELKPVFDVAAVVFPVLLLRNSALLATTKQDQKRSSLNLQWQDLFLKQDALLREQARTLSTFALDLEPQKAALEKQFEDLLALAQKTHPAFLGAVKAQQHKQIKGLEKLEARLVRAQRYQYRDVLERVGALQDALFPAGSLQERKENFAAYWLESPQLLPQLVEKLKPLDGCFQILVL